MVCLASLFLFCAKGRAFAENTQIQKTTAKLKSLIKAKTGLSWEVFVISPETSKVINLGRTYPEPPPGSRAKEINKEQAKTIALNFLSKIKDELGIKTVEEIEILDTEIHHYTAPQYLHRGYSITVSYRQTYEGIPVYGPINLVSMNKYGEVYLVQNSWLPGIMAPKTPRISMEKIKQHARDYFQTDSIDFFEEPELFILPPESLVWRLQLGKPVHKEVLFDAVTGVMVKAVSNIVR